MAGTISKQNKLCCKKMELKWIWIQILFTENRKVLIKILHVSVCPKITWN